MVRKPPDSDTAYGQVGRSTCHRSTDARKLKNLANRGVDLIEELDTEPFASTLVPTARLPILGLGFVLEVNESAHRLRRSDSAGFGTSCDEAPTAPPAKTRRARPLNLGGPGRLDFGWILTAIIKTGVQFGSDIGALVNGQGQRSSKKLLSPRGHGAIFRPQMAAQQPLAADGGRRHLEPRRLKRRH